MSISDTCSVEGCINKIRIYGLCSSHYGKWFYKQPGNKERSSYRNMIDRCYNPKNKAYYNYGQRGIDVCASWQESFENFYKDMGTCPEYRTLERMDNDKGYSPENCRWATRVEQQLNTRISRNNRAGAKFVHFRGDTHREFPWVVKREFMGRRYNMGNYRTKEEAELIAVALDKFLRDFVKHYGVLTEPEPLDTV